MVVVGVVQHCLRQWRYILALLLLTSTLGGCMHAYYQALNATCAILDGSGRAKRAVEDREDRHGALGAPRDLSQGLQFVPHLIFPRPRQNRAILEEPPVGASGKLPDAVALTRPAHPYPT